MKKLISLTLALLMVLSLCACGGNADTTPQTTTEPAPAFPDKPTTLKVLTLGHSLAVDSGHMLALIADAEGYEDMTVATLYYSGCPLYRHVEYLTNNTAAYDLYVSKTSTADTPPTIMEDVTMLEALRYDKWDIIIMQGGVFEIAAEATYTNGHIQTIQDYVNKNKLNPDAVFGWNMAWAPPVDPDLMVMYPLSPNTYESGYLKYGNDRTTMYQSITKCVTDHILTDDTFVRLIPSGTAMENALSSYMTEKDIHRDYVHASDLARVMVSYVWYCTLAGIDHLDQIKMDTIPAKFFRSTTGTADRVLTETEKAVILESVNNALSNPLQMTQSQYTQAPADAG